MLFSVWPVFYRSGYLYYGGRAPAQADELFTQAAALIEEEYAEQPGFTVGEVRHKDDCSYSRSFDLSFGATGIDYTLKVQGKQPEHKLLQAVLMKS